MVASEDRITAKLAFDHTSRTGWSNVRFDQMAENITDRVDDPAEAGVDYYVGLEHLDPESLKIRRWGMPTDVEATKLRFHPGDIIFGRRRAYQRKLAVGEFEGICSAHALVLRARPETVLPEFLPFFMQSETFYERAMEISVGSLSPTINWKTLAQQEFALPPRDEQQRIAEILRAADEGAYTAVALEETSRQIERVLANETIDRAAIECEGNGRLVPLEEILSSASDGPFGSKLKTVHYSSGGARVVRLQNIGEGFFDDSDRSYISSEYFRELVRYSLSPADILVAGLGDETHPVGRVCQVPEELGSAIHKADCFCLRPMLSIVNSRYLVYALNSGFVQHQVLQFAQGTTRLRINVTNMKRVRVPVPEYDTQLEICVRLDAANEAVERASQNVKAKLNLQKALREALIAPIG